MTPLEAAIVLRARGFAAEVDAGDGRIRGGRTADEAGGIRFFSDAFAIERVAEGWTCRFVNGLHVSAHRASSLADAVEIVTSVLDLRPLASAADRTQYDRDVFRYPDAPARDLVDRAGGGLWREAAA